MNSNYLFLGIVFYAQKGQGHNPKEITVIFVDMHNIHDIMKCIRASSFLLAEAREISN
jgi:hypothetical protein